MTDRFDIVVAGAGHNSLVAAAYLAKAGYRCLILEGRSILGGNVITEELTLPGFRHDSCGTAHVILQDSPMMRNDELGLADYGLEYIHPEIVCHAPFLDGSWLTQYHDIERTIEQFGKFSKKDADAYRRMYQEYDAIKPLFDAASYTPIGFGKPINDRLNEHPDGKKWLRRQARSAWEVARAISNMPCRNGSSTSLARTRSPPREKNVAGVFRKASRRRSTSACFARSGRWRRLALLLRLTGLTPPGPAKPSVRAAPQALSTISDRREKSGVSSGCTPHTSASRRAVVRSGVRLRIGAAGRSRAARRAVRPAAV